MHFSQETLFKVLALATAASASPIVSFTDENGAQAWRRLDSRGELAERQGGFSGCGSHKTSKWVKADDPNPHQNFVFKQLTPSVQCAGSPSNSVAVSKGLTVGWSFSIGVGGSGNPAAGGLGSIVDAGFSVSESVTTTTTQTFGCSTDDGKSQTEPVCGFQRVQVTAYTVKEQSCDTSDATCGNVQSNCVDTGTTGVIYAPNSDQGGSDTASGNCYYNNFQLGLPCVTTGNEIRSNPASIPGGPQYVSCTDPRSAPGQ